MASYPISNVPRRIVYAASGVGPYAFPFEILTQTDIAVFRDDQLLTLTTDYTVSIDSDGTGGITLTASPVGATQIALVGARAIERVSDFTTGGDFFAVTVNEELDSLTIFAQQNAEAVNRALSAPQTDPLNINMTLPRAADRADKFLAFDSVGNPVPGATPQELQRVLAIENEITAVANIDTQVVTVAGISTNVTTVAGNSANVTTVAGISGDVTAVAGISTDIPNVVAISSEIIDVAAVASDIPAVAAVASDIPTVAANVADITNFADVYQGASATDPTLRNDSSALQAGDLYFNTASDELRVYTGSQWVAGTAGTLSSQRFSGDGITTVFTLFADPKLKNNTQVYINGVYQQKDSYSVSGTALTFDEAPPTGTENIEVVTVSTFEIVVGSLTGGTVDNTVIGGTTPDEGTFTILNATTGNIATVNATDVDTTNIEVTNIKAKDGTASASIADSTGVMTVASSVLTTADINGGTIDGTTIGATSASTGAFTTLSSTSTATLNGTTIPASATLTKTTDKLNVFAATTSAELAGVISDETGTGALVFANSPTLVTPALGTPASGVVTNLTGTASININGTVGATTPNTGAFTDLRVGVTTTVSGGISSEGKANLGLVSYFLGNRKHKIYVANLPTITTTEKIRFTFKTVQARTFFVKLSVQLSSSGSGAATNDASAEYWVALHTDNSTNVTSRSLTTMFENNFVRATHFVFANLGSSSCYIELSNPTGATLDSNAGKIEVLGDQINLDDFVQSITVV